MLDKFKKTLSNEKVTRLKTQKELLHATKWANIFFMCCVICILHCVSIKSLPFLFLW